MKYICDIKIEEMSSLHSMNIQFKFVYDDQGFVLYDIKFLTRFGSMSNLMLQHCARFRNVRTAKGLVTSLNHFQTNLKRHSRES
jgi:hypothetical protein